MKKRSAVMSALVARAFATIGTPSCSIGLSSATENRASNCPRSIQK
jgi:hypothetical protein